MKFIRGICRLIVGVVFVLSGVLKLIDPLGTGLIVEEYLAFMHLVFLKPVATAIGIALSSVEFAVGASMLLGTRIKFFSWAGLILISFFTLLTLYLAIFNPISDCGCFGQAVHLTNWQTFSKNVVLLLCFILIFAQRSRIEPVAHPALEWAVVALLFIDALWVSFSALLTLPPNDYTAYRQGTDFNEIHEGRSESETLIVYTKDGITRSFGLDNLPDSTWTFVETVVQAPESDYDMAQVDLSLRDLSGEYRTDMLYAGGPLIAAVVWDPSAMTSQRWDRIRTLRDNALRKGMDIRLFSIDENVPSSLSDVLYIADRKALLTLLRSNGGAVLFNSGVIVRKWPSSAIDSEKVMQTVEADPDETILHDKMRLKAYNTANVLGTIFVVLLFRYLCSAFRKKGRKGVEM